MAVELNRTIQVFPQPASSDTSEATRPGKEITKDHGRTIRQAILVTIAGAVILTTFAGAGIIQRMRGDSDFDMQMRRSASRLNIFHGFEFFFPTTNTILQEYALDIERIAEQYHVPSQSLEYIIIKELGDDRNGVPGAFGMGRVFEQYVKASINAVRIQGVNDQGDFTPPDEQDKEHQLGLSFGLINLKPGLFTQKVIANIKDEKLRQYMIDHYDHIKHHVDDKALDTIVRYDLRTALELEASYMELWMEPIRRYVESRTELTQQQKDDLALEISINLTGSFPYARNYMYQLLGEFAPDLRD